MVVPQPEKLITRRWMKINSEEGHRRQSGGWRDQESLCPIYHFAESWTQAAAEEDKEGEKWQWLSNGLLQLIEQWFVRKRLLEVSGVEKNIAQSEKYVVPRMLISTWVETKKKEKMWKYRKRVFPRIRRIFLHILCLDVRQWYVLQKYSTGYAIFHPLPSPFVGLLVLWDGLCERKSSSWVWFTRGFSI